MHDHPLVRQEKDTAVRRVLIITLVLNIAVAAAKIGWGYVTGSVGMVSDGFHSTFDSVTNVLGLIGLALASRPPDKDHPYGHRKYETMLTIVISFMIFGTCIEVLRRAFMSLFGTPTVQTPDMSFVVIGGTMAVNFMVMIYESRQGKKLHSPFLIADAKHTMSDIYASSGVLAGLLLARAGYPRADALAGLVVTFFIARTGISILKEATDVLVDKVTLDTGAVKYVALGVPGVKGCHRIRTRGTPASVHLDLHLQLAKDISLQDAHVIGHDVEKEIKRAFPQITDIVVHIEPEW